MRRFLLRPSPTTPAWRSKSGASSRAARWTRRASVLRGLVAIHQRRAVRIAFQYLRDARRSRRSRPGRLRQGFHAHRVVPRGLAVRGLVHAHSHQRVPRPPEIARTARSLVRRRPTSTGRSTATESTGGRPDPDPEERLLARERRGKLAAAIDRLDGRQRTVFMLCHYGDCSPARGQRDDRHQRIDGSRASVPRRPQAARVPRRQIVIVHSGHLKDDHLFECYLATQTGEELGPARGGAPGRLRRVRGPLRRSGRVHGHDPPDGRRRNRRGVPGRASARPAAADPPSSRARAPVGPRDHLPGPRRVVRLPRGRRA